jgi:hypothetical protein
MAAVELSRRPGIVGRRRRRLARGCRRRGERRCRRRCRCRRRARHGRRRCRGHGGRCRRAGRCRDGFLFLRNQLFRRCRRPQVHVNWVGREPGRALGLRTHGQGLRLIAAQRKRYGELAAGLNRKLTRGATALAQRGFRFRPWRLGLNGQRLGLRSRLQEIQARHRCGTCGQHEATRHDGNDSAHDWIPPTGRHRAASPPDTTIEARQGLRNRGAFPPHAMVYPP